MHNVRQRPFNILLARDVSSPFCPVIALFHYCKVRGDRPSPLFCHADLISISAVISSLTNFSAAYLIVVLTLVGTKAIAFVSVLRATQLKKDIPMCKSVLLFVGNQAHSKLLEVRGSLR